MRGDSVSGFFSSALSAAVTFPTLRPNTKGFYTNHPCTVELALACAHLSPASRWLTYLKERSAYMKRIFAQLTIFAGMLVGVVYINPVRAQTTEGPANPPVYACVDTVAGIQSVRWVASLPCIPPLFGTTQEGQPSQTAFTAAFNSDGTLAGSSALSGSANFDAIDGIYTITFTSAFASVPICEAVLVGANSTDFQSEVSSVSTTGATVGVQSSAPPYGAAASSFVLSCSNPH